MHLRGDGRIIAEAISSKEQDLAGFRNDLWVAEPVEDPQAPGSVAYRWARFGQDRYFNVVEAGRSDTYPIAGIGSPMPPARAKSALFWSPELSRLVLWGGVNETGILGDLWTFSPWENAWTEMEPRGDVPYGLHGFAYTQGHLCVTDAGRITTQLVESLGRDPGFGDLCERVGFILGGERPDGSLSDELFVFSLEKGEFRLIGGPAFRPPAMKGVSLSFDPWTGRLYLFGGFDGATYHNWLWYLDTGSMTWRLLEDDCVQGQCPYLVNSSALVASGQNRAIALYPGKSAVDGAAFVESYLLRHEEGGWVGSSNFLPWKTKGDCDADGVKEPYWNAKCGFADPWYRLPGDAVCDTLTRGLACVQEPLPEVTTHEMRVPGLKSIKARDEAVFVAAGGRLLSFSEQDLLDSSSRAEVGLHGEARDMALWNDKVVVAVDQGLRIVDAAEPSRLVVEREIHTCGSVFQVSVSGDSAYFLTTAGIGSVDLADAESEIPDRFGIILKVSETQWDVMEIPPETCADFSDASGIHCMGPGCSADGFKKLDRGMGLAFISSSRELLVIDMRDPVLEVRSSLGFSSKIEGLKASGGHLYLNLKNGRHPLILVDDPSDPWIIGEHDAAQWVDGIEKTAGMILRTSGNVIEMAVLP